MSVAIQTQNKKAIAQSHSDLFGKLDIIDNSLFKDVAMVREEILEKKKNRSVSPHVSIR